MKKVVLIALFVMGYAFAKAESSVTLYQQFVSHQVKDGETVYSISKKYNVSQKEIFKLNPDAKSSIYEGLVLILPSEAKESSPIQEEYRFKKHKVRRKETLFSISQKYDVPIDVIKKFNKHLYSKPLRKGDRLQIPLNYEGSTTQVTSAGGGVVTPQDAPSEGVVSTTTYIVKPKETKYGLARIYGITIAELEALNPGMGNGLREGQTINVPVKKTVGSSILENSDFEFYEVQKGDTMYSLLRRLSMEADALVKLNPALDDGLKEGMILKIPRGFGNVSSTTEINADDATKINLADSISDYSMKRLAVMLPFSLQKIKADTSKTSSDYLKSDRLLRIALDFHSGVLMAIEAAKEAGISTDLRVYDTNYVRADGNANARKVENIISDNDFSDVDVVIGPLLSANVNRASSILSRMDIPLVSPLTPKVNMSRNVFQSRPSDKTLRDKMLAFLKANGDDKNIIIIADKKSTSARNALKTIFPGSKEVNPRSSEKGYYLYPDDIPSQLSETKENWVLLETNDIPLISNVTTNLNKEAATKKVKLFTTNKGTAYNSDEIQHMDLMNLNFHFPSVDRESMNEESEAFVAAYEDHYGITPSEHAVRGYDITFDTLMRLAYARDLYSAADSGIETEQVENKFRYGKNAGSGYVNEAVFLMKYGPDLKLEEVELTSGDQD